MRNLAQERLGQGLESSQFIDQCRVEHHIRIFLIGEDITFLAASHGFPTRKSFTRDVSALAGIAHNAADETCIGGGDAVVAIEVELGQRRNVDAESLPGQGFRDQARIEAVDAFQNDDLPALQSERFHQVRANQS